MAYAGLGLRNEAIRHGQLGVEALPVAQDALSGSQRRRNLAEIYAMVGDYEAAIDELEYLLSIPSFISTSLIQVDPIFEPLRDHPRFQALLEKYE